MRKSAILLALFSIASMGTAQVGPWPMERQDRWGTGRALVGPDPATQVAPWIKYRVTGELVSHAPSIRQDGTAFFGAWIPSLLTKFQTATGTPQGSFEALAFIHSLSAIGENGHVYFTTSHSQGRLFAIDPTIGLRLGFSDELPIWIGLRERISDDRPRWRRRDTVHHRHCVENQR